MTPDGDVDVVRYVVTTVDRVSRYLNEEVTGFSAVTESTSTRAQITAALVSSWVSKGMSGLVSKWMSD